MSTIPSDPRRPDSERFAALVAHELKGSLATLAQYAKGLESAAASGDRDRLHHDIDRIQQIARDLAETVDALLLDAKQGATATQETSSLHEAAVQAVDILRESIQAAQIEIVIAPDLPTVRGSQILWRQVYRNLIDNAVKACAGVEQPRIEIGCDQRGSQITCFVRDNGRGLKSADRANLFDPHYSHGSSGGSGLGLFLAKRQIERGGGIIWIEENESETILKFTIAGTSS